MFNVILTLIRGRAHDAEQAFINRNAVPLLAQQIRDAANGIQSARRAVAIAVAQNEQEKSQHTAIAGRIADLETRAVAALQKGNDELARQVSRRLSPGISADLGAGWFEGLAQRNRYALLTRLALWEQLANYVASLNDDEFKRALVFLRRAFGDFSPSEKRSITENLGEIWGANPDTVSEVLSEELTEKEKKKLDELSDFNFEEL